MTAPKLAIPSSGQLAALWERRIWKVVVFLGGAVLLGAVGGLVWALTTHLPSYVVREDLSATMSELELADIIGADASFTLITGIVGLVIGVGGWMVLHRAGWVVTIVPPAAALGASLMAWRLGTIVGSSGFTQRLAVASAGDAVQVDLQLRALSALLVGPFAAVTPIMLLAAFWPEPPSDQAEGEPAGNR